MKWGGMNATECMLWLTVTRKHEIIKCKEIRTEGIINKTQKT